MLSRFDFFLKFVFFLVGGGAVFPTAQTSMFLDKMKAFIIRNNNIKSIFTIAILPYVCSMFNFSFK